MNTNDAIKLRHIKSLICYNPVPNAQNEAGYGLGICIYWYLFDIGTYLS